MKNDKLVKMFRDHSLEITNKAVGMKSARGNFGEVVRNPVEEAGCKRKRNK